MPPRMFRNGPAMCAQPAVAAFLLALNNPALQAFHQHLLSLFLRAVPSVPPAASPLMSAATRPPARTGKLSDSDLHLHVRRSIADTTDEASCIGKELPNCSLPIVANIKNQVKRSARSVGRSDPSPQCSVLGFIREKGRENLHLTYMVCVRT